VTYYDTRILTPQTVSQFIRY